MPVHRLIHDKNPTVYALSTEIDEWLAKRSTGPAPIDLMMVDGLDVGSL